MYSFGTCKRGVVYVVITVLVAVGRLGQASMCYAEDLASDMELESSNPPDSYIYPGQDKDRDGNPTGLTEITLTFAAPAQLDASMISVSVSAGDKPSVASVQQVGKDATQWKIKLDRPIPAGESTGLALPNGQMIVLTAIPGDVNQDGILSTQDQIDLLEALQTASTDPLRHDVDGNGSVNLKDYVRLLQLHEAARPIGVGDSPIGEELIPPGVCCVFMAICEPYVGSCPGGTEQVECPCPPIRD